MRIGIIGAGNIGGNLTRRLTELGHDVSVANRSGVEALSGLAEETGATPATVADAVRGAELIVIAIPQKGAAKLDASVLATSADGAPIIDTGNYYPQRDRRIDAIEDGMTESRWVATQLGRPVIKAFNNMYAAHLLERNRDAGADDRLALPVAGDDPVAKATVMALVDELGFDPVDAGGLDDSWRQQPGAPAYAADLDAEGLERALAEASPERPTEFRAA